MIHEQFFIREWSKIFITKRDYLQRYRSQTKIMPNFSLTGSRTMFEEWEWNYLSKNRNNNTDIFLVCGFVRNSCTERSNRYFDRWNEKKSFPRPAKSGVENGPWWRIVAEKRKKKEKGGKNTTTPFIPPAKFRAWGMTLVMQAAEHVNVFNCTPFVGYSRLFISRPGVQPWNCAAITACLDSRKNLSRVWARIGFSSLRSIA